MNKLFIPLISLCLLLSFSSLQAQFYFEDGYIVDLDNDTIYGKIMINEVINYRDSVLFLEGSRKIENTDTYYPHELVGFSSPKKGFFRTVEIKDEVSNEKKDFFLEEVAYGDMSVFVLPRPDESKEYQFILLKEGFDAIYLHQETFRDTLKILTQDCPKMLVASDLVLTKISMGNLAGRYNRCINIEKTRTDEAKLSFLVSASFSVPTRDLQTYDFNHSRVLPPNATQVFEQLDGANIQVELKRKYSPAFRTSIQFQYVWGYRKAIFDSGVFDFTNSIQRFEVTPRIAYFYPANGGLQLYTFLGLGIGTQINDIQYVQPNQPDIYQRFGYISATIGLGTRLSFDNFFLQIEVGNTSGFPLLHVGMGYTF